jgi:hypothetical protein
MKRALVTLLLAMLVPAAARAGDTHLTVEAMTDFPLDVGAKAILELPYRFRLSASVGVLPGAYVNTLNDAMVSFDAYPQSVADLIGDALHSSLIVRLHAGWRPFANHGFYFEAGYGIVTLGGSATSAELTSAAAGRAAPNDPNSAAGYSVDSTLHMIDLELGWEWPIADDHLALRLALGFAGTLSSQTAVTPNFTPQNPQEQQVYTALAAQYLDNIYTKYVFTPVLSFGVGWRIF